MSLANELTSASCVPASIKLIKTMQNYTTTTTNIPLVSDPSTALAEYFHLFPAVMHLRLLHTGYKSVINKRNSKFFSIMLDEPAVGCLPSAAAFYPVFSSG